jgi:NADH:ubiquinone oxidoreductase subunit 4 (subunit M)
MLAALLTLAYVLLNLQKVFMKVNETMENAKLKEVPWKMMLAMAVLAIVVLLLGIYPSPIMLR